MGPPKVHGSIRIRCINIGTSKWKEGHFEISEKDGKATLLVVYKAGGAPKSFKLHQNIKSVLFRPNGNNLSRLMVTLKDASHLTIDRVSHIAGKDMETYLLSVCDEAMPTAKSSLGSGSFGGVLGSRSTQKEDNIQTSAVKNQTPTRRASLENKEETPVRKPLGFAVKTSPGNGTLGSKGTGSPNTSPPLRVGLQESRNEKRKRMQSLMQELNEDYPKENDSSTSNKSVVDPAWKFLNRSREKQLVLRQTEENKVTGFFPMQSSSFYSSRPSKEYSFGNSNTERSNVTSQSPSVKRTLGFTSQLGAVKKMKPNLDYTGWNKSRFQLSSQTQQLQGFSNLGNTCYMNAILQSLFSLQSFVNDLLKQRIPWKKIPVNTLIRRFAFLLSKKDICSSEQKKDLLKRVKGAISATAERFSGYMQNDAHEFLNQCLDQLKEDMEKLNKTWKYEPSSGDENAVGRTSEDCSTSRVFSCPVICNFEFEVQHSISCKMCGEMVTKRERFNDLSIDLPRRRKLPTPRSIQDSLDLFFRTEEIDYSCEKCNGKSASVMHKFNRLPRILILHLKRYSFNVVLSQNNKVGQQVIIPRYLTLSSHCTESTQSPLTLNWSSYNAISRPLKSSQMVNSCSMSTSTPTRKFSFKSTGTKHSCHDSDSEDEQPRRSVTGSQRLFDMPRRDQQQEDLEKTSRLIRTDNEKPADIAETPFDGMSEEELLATVLEMSKKETSLSMSHDEEYKPTSSPDTGFGEDEVPEMADNFDSMVMEKSKAVSEPGPAVSFEISKNCDIAKDFDENKENKTPEGSQADVDWLQQYDLDREEQEIRQAMAQSIHDQEVQAQKEVDDLKRAKELSLQEFNNSLLDSVCSDEDSGNEDIFDMEYTEAEVEELRKNAQNGALPHSYRLISVVSHIGSSSSSGHYISDVFDLRKLDWFTYDDLMVSKIQEVEVQSERDRTGYIFFYMHREILAELLEAEKNSQPLSVELARPNRPPQ
ncbi:ubiquitin carboxyl-terminal hydrolase 37 isoform X1 [Pleurodeles waltl]|uniref:ubiquitin carboxyl-terminal hydrolase 37 isoform X1 n=1 Tax=Pleurodeles waltl TaxID=8319 RepID=UPI00370939CF